MKRPKDLTPEECHEVLERIVKCLYGSVDDETGEDILDPDNEFNIDMFDDLAQALESYELVPEEVVPAYEE